MNYSKDKQCVPFGSDNLQQAEYVLEYSDNNYYVRGEYGLIATFIDGLDALEFLVKKMRDDNRV